MDQPVEPRVFHSGHGFQETDRFFVSPGLGELVGGQESIDGGYVFMGYGQCGFVLYMPNNGIRLSQRPSGDDLEGSPSDVEESVADRVMDGPGRTSVTGGRAGIQRKFITQGRESRDHDEIRLATNGTLFAE